MLDAPEYTALRMSGAGTFAGGALTGTSIVIVRESRPGPLGFGDFPVPVRCHTAFSMPETVIVEPPAQVVPAGQLRTPDQLTQVDDDVHAVLDVGVCWLPLGAQPEAIVVSEVVESVGWPPES